MERFESNYQSGDRLVFTRIDASPARLGVTVSSRKAASRRLARQDSTVELTPSDARRFAVAVAPEFDTLRVAAAGLLARSTPERRDAVRFALERVAP